MNKNCSTCKFAKLTKEELPCRICCGELGKWAPAEIRIIPFRRLNGLKPTLQSCTLKVLEEIGELMQLLGKGQGASGERILPAALGPNDESYAEWVYRTIEETLDSAQSLVTLAFVMADENNIDLHGEIGRHEEKLVKKGYLVEK